MYLSCLYLASFSGKRYWRAVTVSAVTFFLLCLQFILLSVTVEHLTSTCYICCIHSRGIVFCFWRVACGLSFFSFFFFWLCRQLQVVFTSPCVCDSCLHCHMNSLNRCSSRRFSCIFLRRPQAPMTTNGWLYKPSLEYVQVGFSLYFHFSLCHLENRNTLIGADVVQIYLLFIKTVFSCTEMLNNTSYELLPFSRDCPNKVAVSSKD